MATGYLLSEAVPTVDALDVATGFAAGSGVAFNAVGQGVATQAFPTVAAGTGTAFTGATTGTGQPIFATAGVAVGTGTGFGATAKLAQAAAGVASGTGAANSVMPSVARIAAAATGTALAFSDTATIVRAAGFASGTGTANNAGPASRPDIANAPAASNVVLWAAINGIDDLTDAQFIDWRDNWGITTIVCQFSYLYTMGGNNRRTSDITATFTAADGRSGTEWNQCRQIKYGNAGTGTSGLGNIVNRLHALGMKIYAAGRWENLSNPTTVMAEWFSDTAWGTFLAPTGPLAELVSYANAWGFDGIAWDDELAGASTATWKFTYSGNSQNEATTRAKCKQRGAAVGALFASIWPNMDIIEYNTTGLGGFPDDWDEDFAQFAAGRGVDIKESSMQRDFWDGVFSFAGFNGNLRFLSSTFYRSTGSGATWFGAEQYNAVRQLARLSRTWTSWNRAHNHFFLDPFHWPGHATNVPEDNPMSLATMQASFAASRIMGMGHIGFYYQSLSLDNAYFTTAMKDVFRAARVPGTVNTVIPTLSAVIQSDLPGNNIAMSGTATHPVGIAYIEWEIFTDTGSAVETVGAFGHTFTPGTGDHQDATGFADATYPFDGTVPSPAGRKVRVTAVSIKGQSHSVEIVAIGTGSPAAGNAAGTGTANNATVTSQDLSVSAGNASGTGTAFTASTTGTGAVNASATLASGTGTASTATVTTGGYPTTSNTGVVNPASLNGVGVNALVWRTSVNGVSLSTTEVIGGNTYRVFTYKNFIGTTGYISCDDPYVKFVNCQFVWSGLVSNASAMVQGTNTLNAVICQDCTFNGGAASHNRGIQADHGDITILRGNFTRCGNAAIEKNDPTGLWSLTVTDSYITETKGWPPADHADGIQMGDGKNFTVTHNTIWIEPYRVTDGDTGDVSNSCIGLWAEGGNVTGDVLINNNQMSGGGSIMYVEQKLGFTFQGTVTVTGNLFVRNHFSSLQGAQYNPTTGHAAVWYVLAPPGRPPSLSGVGSGWTNNKWEDGTTVTLAVAITST